MSPPSFSCPAGGGTGSRTGGRLGSPQKPSEAVFVGRGAARERTQFSPTGGNGAKRTLRRRVRRVSSRQTRYFLLHQRKYPKSVSRGRTPWIPPTQLKCRHSFPASWTGRCGNSFGGLWPCAGLLSVVSSIQLGAWRGCEKRLGGSIGRARAEGQRSVSCFRSTHHPQSCAPFRGSLFGAMPDQAPQWGAEDGQVWRHQGGARRGNCPAVDHARREAMDARELNPPRT